MGSRDTTTRMDMENQIKKNMANDMGNSVTTAAIFSGFTGSSPQQLAISFGVRII